jgi:hypothetical protein
LARLAEPSSYAGLGTVLTLLGVAAPEPLLQSGVLLAAGAAGVAAFFLKERAS